MGENVFPQDRLLVVSARLATINVDEVHVGQPVVLHFFAFASRTTPMACLVKPLADDFTRAFREG